MSQSQQKPSLGQPSAGVRWAIDVIAGKTRNITTAEALTRAKALKGENRFDLARRVLAIADADPADPNYEKVQQQIANCTYKDRDLPSPDRFYQALDVLHTKCDLENTLVTETLGLAGAVYKGLWDYGGQRGHLEQSLAHYSRAYDRKPDDEGYVAINTAFVLDLLAWKESATLKDAQSGVPRQRFAEAERIRREIIATLTATPPAKPTWWFCATLGEAALGIGDFAEAVHWLAEGKKTDHQPWERNSTTQQLAILSRVQSERRGETYRVAAAEVLKEGLGITQQAVKSILLGKVGLALSGGGFRASLFHIGVLAKLAELDVLRHIEVLSCVSGGSIVGAHYYLELKKRLELSASLTQDDYLDIVQSVEREFLIGVQSNVRTRIASSIPASLMMAFWPGYTRTTRAGKLYEERLYKRVDGVARRSLPSLLIKPYGTQSFSPRYDNWNRDSKVPILVLNATTINTGHNWQFTATWMGESPQAISGAIDAIPRLRRLYIDGRDDIPESFKDFPLGQAVGASAAVPGVFDPIVLRNLYPDRTVRLSDGGVHDNQGLASLLEESCNVLLVSDASGQMRDDTNPSGGVFSVAGRTNTILQARVREAQFKELQALQRSGAINGSMFIHLTKDLEAEAISFQGAQDVDSVAENPPPLTEYGVDRAIQKQLAEIRTDLDSFSDAEAYALMLSGYLMSEHALLVEKCTPTLPMNPRLAQWRFLRVCNALTVPGSDDNVRMGGLLKASKELAGKAWRQVVPLKALGVVVLLGGAVWLFASHADLAAFLKRSKGLRYTSPTMETIAVGAGVLALIVIGRYFTDKVLHAQKRFGEFLLGIMLASAGFFGAWLHLSVFDQIFLWHGRWDEPKQPVVPPDCTPPGSVRLPIQPATKVPPPKEPWTPVVRRILNLFSKRR